MTNMFWFINKHVEVWTPKRQGLWIVLFWHQMQSDIIGPDLIWSQVRSDQMCPKEVRSDQIWIRSDPIKIRSDQVRSGSDQIQSRSGQIRSGQIRSNEIRSDQVQWVRIWPDLDLIWPDLTWSRVISMKISKVLWKFWENFPNFRKFCQILKFIPKKGKYFCMLDQIRSGQVRKYQVKMDLTSGQIRSNRIRSV